MARWNERGEVYCVDGGVGVAAAPMVVWMVVWTVTVTAYARGRRREMRIGRCILCVWCCRCNTNTCKEEINSGSDSSTHIRSYGEGIH